MDTGKILLYGGGAVAAYFLFLAPKTPGISSNPLNSILNPGSAGISTTVGINSGVKGGNGSFYLCSNYAALLSANPNLGNPSYILSPAENSQYLANYSDLQTGLPTWVGQKDNRGITVGSLSQAVQEHWSIYGCAEKRIFLPMQPPSTAAFIPPPANPKSSGGSSTLSTVLGTAVSVLGLLLGEDEGQRLNDKDLELLFTGSKVVFDILPFYVTVDPKNSGLIGDKLTEVLNDYM